MKTIEQLPSSLFRIGNLFFIFLMFKHQNTQFIINFGQAMREVVYLLLPDC